MKLGNIQSDSELVRSFVAHGDNSAFTQLIDRYRNRVYKQISYLVKDRELANDLFQDTCVKVLLMLREGKYNEEGKFSAWLQRVTNNIVMDYYRKSQNQAMSSILTPEGNNDDVFNRVELSEPPAEHYIVEQQVRDSAVKLMQSLPETQREILEMRFYKDMSFKEIADKKDISINTALGRMHYAVNNMRKLARKHRVALTA